MLNTEPSLPSFGDDFKVGTCVSSYSVRNSSLQNTLLKNFNSITAENEGKPEQIIDQAACQELAKTNPGDVAIKMSPFEKIDIESQLTGYSSAGCITYVELDTSVKNNLEGLEQIVNYAMDHDIPYFAVNTINDTCLDCGFTDDLNGECPMCGGHNIQELRRVTGYLTGNYKTAFNAGKIAETDDRVRHTGRME